MYPIVYTGWGVSYLQQSVVSATKKLLQVAYTYSKKLLTKEGTVTVLLDSVSYTSKQLANLLKVG